MMRSRGQVSQDYGGQLDSLKGGRQQIIYIRICIIQINILSQILRSTESGISNNKESVFQ